MAVILLITGERAWTQRAAHLAGALAREMAIRETDTGVLILRMAPVEHLEYLGAALCETQLPYAEFIALRDYAAIVESYGVPVGVQLFEYSDYIGGVLSAAEQSDAAAVFAPAPAVRIPYIARLRLWWMRRMMRCPLYVLGEGDGDLLLAGDHSPNDTIQPQLGTDLLTTDH